MRRELFALKVRVCYLIKFFHLTAVPLNDKYLLFSFIRSKSSFYIGKKRYNTLFHNSLLVATIISYHS